MTAIRSITVAALERGASVITPHERSARLLRAHGDTASRNSGLLAWQAPAIHTWSGWRQQRWSELLVQGTADALLLSADQEHLLWCSILEADPAHSTLASLDQLAGLAMSAWARLCAFAGEDRLRSGPSPGWRATHVRPTADSNALARWAASFVQRCRSERLLSAAQLDGALGTALDAGLVQPETRELLLVGFEELLPSQTRLVEALRRHGILVEEAKQPTETIGAKLTCAADPALEREACARWAWSQVSSGRRVALVVPALGEAQALARAVREALFAREAPATLTRGLDLSQPGPLAQQPMIAAALDLVRLCIGPLPIDRISSLLLSRYVAADIHPVAAGHGQSLPLFPEVAWRVATPEWTARAEFDAFELRAQPRLRPELTLSTLLREVQRSRRAKSLQSLSQALDRMQRELGSLPEGPRTYAEWASAIRTLVRAAGCGVVPGNDSTRELELQMEWDGLLDMLASLDFAGTRITFAAAAHRLEQLAQGRTVSLGPVGAPLRILTPDQADGDDFDALWFVGAGETTWPEPTRSLPMLPWAVQRELNMPGTDRAREAERATARFRVYAARAPEVIFSYALQTPEGAQRAAAPLRSLHLPEVSAATIAGPAPPRVPSSLELDDDADSRGPLDPLPDRVLPGGVRVLEAQAACAFRAFAEHRLGSVALDESGLGLDSGERGTLVHRALEHLWSALGSQQHLLALSATERDQTIAEAVAVALARAPRAADLTWESAYLDLERERLHRLLSRWLEVEAARSDFTVHLQERDLGDVRVGPLRLSLRIDRVDLVAGRRVLIDYKTGRSATQGWKGDRPDAPQLPLYAVLTRDVAGAAPDAVAEPLGAVAFASVHAGNDARMRGFAESTDLLPSVDRTMDASTFAGQMDLWKGILEALAFEFAAGGAAVRPKHYPTTCAHCAQRMLCRLDPLALDPQDGAEVDLAEDEDG